jgi:hypothetical protein
VKLPRQPSGGAPRLPGMPTVTLPPRGDYPERYLALRMLCEAGARPRKIVRVYAAGDPEAQLSGASARRETILFVDASGAPQTAIVSPIGEIVCRPGWD